MQTNNGSWKWMLATKTRDGIFNRCLKQEDDLAVKTNKGIMVIFFPMAYILKAFVFIWRNMLG